MKKPRKLQPPKPDDRVELFIETSRDTVRDYHSGEQWGEWETIYNSRIDKVSRNKDLLHKWSFEAFKVPQSTYDADKVYVVVVTYSSGDTFGCSYGNIAIAFVTEDADEAIKAKKAVETDWSDKWRDHPKGVGYAPWNGYFEGVQSVEIQMFNVMG